MKYILHRTNKHNFMLETPYGTAFIVGIEDHTVAANMDELTHALNEALKKGYLVSDMDLKATLYNYSDYVTQCGVPVRNSVVPINAALEKATVLTKVMQ